MHFRTLPFSILLLLVGFSTIVQAQIIGEWKVYSSFSTVNNVYVSSDGNFIYGATLGGVLEVENEEMNTYTTVDGMSGLNPSAALLDEENQQLILGYSTGILDFFDIQRKTVTSVSDINRVSQFTTRSINDIHKSGDELYVATDFGIVVFDAKKYYVLNSYLKIGDYARGTTINAIDLTQDSIFVGTEQGVGMAALSDNLLEADSWITIESPNEGTEDITDVAAFDGKVWAVVNDSLFTYNEGSWKLTDNVSPFGVKALIRSEERLLALYSDGIIAIHPDNSTASLFDNREVSIQDGQLKNGVIYVGTDQHGVIVQNLETKETKQYLPEGPYLNFFSELVIKDGELLASATDQYPQTDPFNRIRGYYVLKDGEWSSYNVNTNQVLNEGSFVRAYQVDITDEHYFVGSWGSGMVKQDRVTEEITLYNSSNSGFSGIDANRDYIVISGLDTDPQNNTWAVSFISNVPLNVYSPEEDRWYHFLEDELPESDSYFKLFADSYNNLWISLVLNNSGRGLLILNPGSDITSSSDDTYIKLTTDPDEGNLPDNYVSAFAEDKDGEVWIGTQRGIARFIFPQGITESSNSINYLAQWLINEDTSAVSRYLLRDVNVSAIAVNSANQKWIGSVNQGVWLLNEEGSAIIHHFTTDNSGLISNNIQSIAIDEETGEVFIATDMGLVSYKATSKAPVEDMGTLKVFPNPFVYTKNELIYIEGLAEITSIKIFGVDGTVVHELEARGGRISWNGLDYTGNKLASGVYFIVAYTENGSQKGIGKVVIIR